jgi:hypothetical protein
VKEVQVGAAVDSTVKEVMEAAERVVSFLLIQIPLLDDSLILTLVEGYGGGGYGAGDVAVSMGQRYV